VADTITFLITSEIVLFLNFRTLTVPPLVGRNLSQMPVACKWLAYFNLMPVGWVNATEHRWPVSELHSEWPQHDMSSNCCWTIRCQLNWPHLASCLATYRYAATRKQMYAQLSTYVGWWLRLLAR